METYCFSMGGPLSCRDTTYTYLKGELSRALPFERDLLIRNLPFDVGYISKSTVLRVKSPFFTKVCFVSCIIEN